MGGVENQGSMHMPGSACGVRRGVALALVAVATPASAAVWHYTIGVERAAQQVNLCDARADVIAIAEVFRRQGALPGYTALAQADGCRRLISTFTPRQVTIEVTISKGKPGEYKVRFVEVDTTGAGRRYLVTTREVRRSE